MEHNYKMRRLHFDKNFTGRLTYRLGVEFYPDS